MNNTTKYSRRNTGDVPPSLIFLLVILIIISLFIPLLFPLVIFSVICFLIARRGSSKAEKEIRKENKYLEKTNPYIYFRELPNYYGIGVTTLLMDSTIENYKDIVAVILDLCARKYLNLEKHDKKYVIKVLKGIDSDLLSNEKYIMSLILCNEVKNINYSEWFDYCMNDGINLGLYAHEIHENDMVNPSATAQKRFKNDEVIKVVISLIVSCALFFVSYKDDLVIAVLSSIFCFPFMYFVLTIVFGVSTPFREIFKKANYYKNEMYVEGLNNKLIRTEKGIDEVQKLYSFKAFINDFGHFVDKKPEEVVLWDRYLSYAQVFGLTKSIMKTGYEQLVNNSSFKIDSIDNITMYNIEVENNLEK